MYSSIAFLAVALASFTAANNIGSYEHHSSSNSTSTTSSSLATSWSLLSTSSTSCSTSLTTASTTTPGHGYAHPTGSSSSRSSGSLSSTSSTISVSLPGTGYAHPTGSHKPTTKTETEMVYTTTTVCPITITTSSASSVYVTTKLTTSTLTITSCKGGCHHSAGPSVNTTKTLITSTTASVTTPTASTFVETKTYDVTGIKTITKFVPCSTPVSSSGSQTWYSTYLTISHSESTIVHPTTVYVTHGSPATLVAVTSPAQATGSSIVTVSPVTHTVPSTSPVSEVQDASTCKAKTIYSTVTGSAGDDAAATPCSSCHTETVTVTLSNGYKTIVTITATPTSASAPGSTFAPGQSQSWSKAGPSSGNAKPTGTRHYRPTGGYAAPSGTAPWATSHKHSDKAAGYGKAW